MLKFSKAAQYGLRAVIGLAQENGEGKAVSIEQVADTAEVPPCFLRKLISGLKHSGIVSTIQGQQGGIALMKDPASLSVLEILEAAGEKIYLHECVYNPTICEKSPQCSIRPVWAKTTNLLREKLDSITIAELAGISEMEGRAKTYSLKINMEGNQ